MPAAHTFVLADEISRIAPGNGLAVLQVLNDDTEHWPASQCASRVEITSVVAAREGDLTSLLCEHFGITGLPSVVIFRDRNVVSVLPGPLTSALVRELCP